MLFRTHIVFSVSVYFLLSYILEMPFFVLAFFVLGAAFVDIDEGNSKLGKRWFFRPLQWLSKHRGILHTLFLAVLLSCIVGMVSLWGGFGFFVGYISHLLLDCFTKSGVRILWPLKFRIKGFVKSGGTLEDTIFVLLLLGNIFIVGKMLFNHLF